MCFVQGVNLGFSAITIPRLIVLANFDDNLGEGKYNGKTSFISRIKVARGIVSLRAANKAIYSGSAVDRAISVCNLLCQ
jgi:hypothetical protein